MNPNPIAHAQWRASVVEKNHRCKNEPTCTSKGDFPWDTDFLNSSGGV